MDIPNVAVTKYTQLDAIGKDAWNELWSRADCKSVYARYEWAYAWCSTFCKNLDLDIYVAHQQNKLVGILPLVALDGKTKPSSLTVLLGNEHSDYASILIDASTNDFLGHLLQAATKDLPSNCKLLLRNIRCGTLICDELFSKSHPFLSRWQKLSDLVCPSITFDHHTVRTLLNKSSSRRKENRIKRMGSLTVYHNSLSQLILPRLDLFFSQHVERWAETEYPSLFRDTSNREFYRRLTEEFDSTGLLIFTELRIEEKPAAFHFGFVSENALIWYKPSFDVSLAGLSPGTVMLHRLILHAELSGLSGLDFTRGEEEFKSRFANHKQTVHTFCYRKSLSKALISKLTRNAKRIFADIRSLLLLRCRM